MQKTLAYSLCGAVAILFSLLCNFVFYRGVINNYIVPLVDERTKKTKDAAIEAIYSQLVSMVATSRDTLVYVSTVSNMVVEQGVRMDGIDDAVNELRVDVNKIIDDRDRTPTNKRKKVR